MEIVKGLLIIYGISINVIGIQMMKRDKYLAVYKKRRTREATLWKAAFAGGALGMTIGMKMYRHKTKHAAFKWGLPTLAVIELIVYSIVTMLLG